MVHPSGREWAVPSCGACLRIVERRHGYRPGDDVISSLGRGVVDAIVHDETGNIQAVATFNSFVVTLPAQDLIKDPDGEIARKTAVWAMGGGR